MGGMKVFALPRSAVLLGLAGIAPQAICLLLVVTCKPWMWVALAAGCFYAAIILSFLGGLWWMAALLCGRNEIWMYLLAVLPSLAGWAALLPWTVGWTWPAPSLATLGALLLASPLADRLLSRHIALPAGWLRLRVLMASGLGSLTLPLALAASWH
jgi:Protein of unknown function (DUF3429)